MAKPYDVSTRSLVEDYPETWLAYLGIVPDGPVSVLDANLSTVSAEADKVIRIDGPVPLLVHLEMQTSADPTLARRLLRYNAMIDLTHDARVRSVLILLRPQADRADLTGVLDLRRPDGRPIVTFHYDVVRVWRRPVEDVLAGDVVILPLAPLADVPENQVPEVLRAVDDRLSREAPPALATRIRETALVLAGMRLDEPLIDALRRRLQTVNITTESSYYRLA